jgi:hypothetical protein
MIFVVGEIAHYIYKEGFPARDSSAVPAKRYFSTALYPSLTAHAKVCDSPNLRFSKSRLAD